MFAYRVTAPGINRYEKSLKVAKKIQSEWHKKHSGADFSAVKIERVYVPTDKRKLLVYLNEILEKSEVYHGFV
jgi:hypothetical protein